MYLHPVGEPALALFDLPLREGQLYRLVVVLARVLELDPVTSHVGEVLLRLLRRRGTQT